MDVELPALTELLTARVVALSGTTGYSVVRKGAGENAEAGGVLVVGWYGAPVPEVGTEGCGAVAFTNGGLNDVSGMIGGMINVVGFIG